MAMVNVAQQEQEPAPGGEATLGAETEKAAEVLSRGRIHHHQKNKGPVVVERDAHIRHRHRLRHSKALRPVMVEDRPGQVVIHVEGEVDEYRLKQSGVVQEEGAGDS